MMRKRGGEVSESLKEEGLVRKAKGGGIHLTAGAASGVARLEKLHQQPKVTPVEVASKGR